MRYNASTAHLPFTASAPAPAPSAQPRRSAPLVSIENLNTDMQRTNLGPENTQEGKQVEFLTQKVEFLQSVVAQKDHEIAFGKHANEAQLGAKDREREELISAHKVELESKDRQIASLKTTLLQQSHPTSGDGVSTLAPPAPFANVEFADDGMDLDTVSLTQGATRFGMWLIHWRNDKSNGENEDVIPDHYMFRLWLGIDSRAKQKNLSHTEIETMFHKLRIYNFADSKSAPKANLSMEERQKKLSMFTGYRV